MEKYDERIANGEKLSKTDMIDYYDNKEAAGIALTTEEKGDRLMLAYVAKQEELRSKDTVLTSQILEKTGWDGESITNTKNKML